MPLQKQSPAQQHLQKEIANDVHNFVEALQQEFGAELLSVVAFGPAACGEYVHWKTEVSLLILIGEATMEHLEAAAKVVSKFLRRFPMDPIVMTPGDLKRARDVIPADLINMHQCHIVLYGLVNPLEEIEIEGSALLTEIEHTLQRKLARLRSQYLRVAYDERALTELITEGIDRFLDILGCLVFVHGKQPPARLRELCTQLRFEFAIDGDTLLALAEVKNGKVSLRRGEPAKLYQSLLGIVEKLVSHVSALEISQ